MNIFYLDEDITLCARYHCDSHVVKMILESVQILCTVLSKNKVSAPYRPTHKNHPCVIWEGESLENWIWFRNLVFELNKEFQYRFDHNSPHKSVLVSNSLALPPIPAIGITERPQAMPEIYKILGDPITAYSAILRSRKRVFIEVYEAASSRVGFKYVNEKIARS